MITIQREKWSNSIDHVMPLAEMAHSLVEKDIYRLPLKLDLETFEKLDQDDVLHCIVMRDEGRAIGFHWIIQSPLLRFKGHTHAYSDAIFVHPDHRKHSRKLIEFSEQYIKSLGCKSWVLATLDPEYRGQMWQRNGFKKSETIFIKRL